MISLPDAFKKFKSRMELNEREQQNASKRQKEVREHLDNAFEEEHVGHLAFSCASVVRVSRVAGCPRRRFGQLRRRARLRDAAAPLRGCGWCVEGLLPAQVHRGRGASVPF